MRNEPLYTVIAYQEPSNEQEGAANTAHPTDDRRMIADNVTHRQAWQIARQAMDENQSIYAVSVRAKEKGHE